MTLLAAARAIPQGAISELMAEQIREFSVADPVAGFFIVAYERNYPKCMDPDPVVFAETTTWDTVVTNGLGTEVARYPHSETRYYNVNKRHAAAFEKVGSNVNPDQIDFYLALFGPTVPKDTTGALTGITDAVRGMRIAMTQNACDSPLIRTLEKNLIGYVVAH